MTDPEQIPHDADPPFAIARHAELVARFEALGEQLVHYDNQQRNRLHGIEQILTARGKLSAEEQKTLYRAWLIALDDDRWAATTAGPSIRAAMIGLCTMLGRVCNLDLPTPD